MGQTLTHGVYLPDEGERNCYNGLAANWQLLDGAVGTIAEHSTQIAGKAPAVHTHTKSDITDFPAYGTTAGTICEGNDSRLSDARTPVAHTHSKADITDLFKSVNTWSAINQYSREIQLAGDRNAYIAPMWSSVASGIAFLSMDAGKQFVFGQRTTDANNRFVYDVTKGYLVLKTGVIGESNYVEVTPHGSDTRLGDSTNKWKTLNGVNPGALSLPDYSKSMNVDTTGWSTSAGRINYTPTVNGWLQIAIPNDIDNNNEKSNFITIMDTDIPNVGSNNPSGISAGNNNDYRIQVTFPVVANKTYYIYIKSYSGNILAVKYIPALGHI